jgi:peptide/nickel transport system permease protein
MNVAATEPIILPAVEPRSRGLSVFLSNRAAVAGALIVAIFVITAIAAPLIAPYDPVKPSFLAIRKPPSMQYLLGTDELGRDILSRLLWGAQASLMAGGISVTIAIALGVPLGLLAGYFGGILDAVISRVTEALLSCPFLVLAIALGAFLGPSLSNAMIAIGLSAMPIFIRLTRGQVIAVRAEDYIEGARAIGLPDRWIILRYVLPNVLSPIVVQATLAIAAAIIAEASLSFLGLGQQPPAPSWGAMLNTAKNYLEQAPWMSLSPGLAIFLTVLGFNLLGDGLRDALDPREL